MVIILIIDVFSYFLLSSDELSYVRCMKLCDTSCHTLSDHFVSLIRIINIWRNDYRMLYFDLDKLTKDHHDSRIDKEIYDSCQGYFYNSTIQCYMVTDVSTDKTNQATDPLRENIISTPTFVSSNASSILNTKLANMIHSVAVTSKRRFVPAEQLMSFRKMSNDEQVFGVTIGRTHEARNREKIFQLQIPETIFIQYSLQFCNLATHQS